MAPRKERCFPRGGKKVVAKTNDKRRNKKLQLFDTASKTARSKRIGSKLQNADRKEHLVAEAMSYRTLADGMTLLGCVIDVCDLYVRISLPGRLVGKVAISNISRPYSQIMRSLLNKAEIPENFYDLKLMFQPGQFVVAKVLKITRTENQNRFKVDLTLDPLSINSNFSHAVLTNGMVLQGAVKSVEDHGYMMDFGIASLTAFLSSYKAKSYINQCNGGRKLGVGQVLLCCVQKVDHISPGTTVAQVTSDPSDVSNSVADINHNISINTLSPGTLVESLVVEEISEGMMVEFLNFKGFIHRDHIGDPPPRLASVCLARVLYSLPLLNTVYLSILLGRKDLYVMSGVKDEKAPKVGQVMRGTIVTSVSRKGVVVSLGKHTGFVSRRKLRDGEEVHPEEVRKLYSVGMSVDIRVIGLDKLENVFICSAQRSTVMQEYFGASDFEAGLKVSGSVLAIKGNGVVVAVDGCGVQGYVPLTQLADFPVQYVQKRFPPGTRVKARVLKAIKDKGNLLLTLKPSLVDSELPILDQYEGAQNIGVVDGSVFKILESGLVVIFYNGIKGFASVKDIGHGFPRPAGLKEVFFEGQTVRCQVIGFNSQHQRLKLSLQLKTEEDPELTSWVGTLFTVKITEVNEDKLVVRVVKGGGDGSSSHLRRRKGIIPALHLSDCTSLCKPLLSTYKTGDTIPAAVLFSLQRADEDLSASTLVFSLRSSVIEFCSTLKGNGVCGEGDEREAAKEPCEKGSVIPCSVSQVTAKGLLLQAPIPFYQKLFVPLHLVSDDVLESIDKEIFALHRPLFGKIMKLDYQKRNMVLSTRLSELWNGFSLEPSLDLTKSYLSAAGCIREHIALGKKTFLSSLVEGQRVHGTIKSICSTGGGASVEIQRIEGMKVKPGVIAHVTPHHYRQRSITAGCKVDAVVIFVDFGENKVYLTLNERTMEEVGGTGGESLPLGKHIRAEILLTTKDVAVALVKGNMLHGELIYLPVKSHCNDLFESLDSMTPLRPGDIHKVIVSGKESGKMIGLLKKKVTLLEKYNQGKARQHHRKRRFPEVTDGDSLVRLDSGAKKRREGGVVQCDGGGNVLGDSECCLERRIVDIGEPAEESGAVVTASGANTDDEAREADERTLGTWEQLPHLQVDQGFVWGADILSLPSRFAVQEEKKSDESSVDGEDDMVSENGKAERKKRGKGALQAEQEEAGVRAAEGRLMDPEACPQTADDFDRLVLSSPDSSIVWLKYVAFHLQNTEIEKARAVAKRALKTISFREEQEKFNIWVCLLNLENLYGTKESLDKVLHDALQMNDPVKVYFQMLQIYLESKKIEELDSLMEVMLKKYKHKEVWMQAGSMCMRSGRPEKAGEMLRRSFKSLPKHDHVSVVCHWAWLEAHSECGSVDRACSLLEGVLATSPNRTDVWSVLVDTLVRANRIQAARDVMERATSQNLPARKMKVLFKKYLSLEEAHGSAESADRVRRMALDYVERRSSL